MNFNYPMQIRAFWQLVTTKDDVTSSARLLYLVLLDFCNKYNKWAVDIYVEDILIHTGTSRNTYYEARKNLEKSELITIIKGKNGVKKCRFLINPLYQNKDSNKKEAYQNQDSRVTEAYQNQDSRVTEAYQNQDSSLYHALNYTTDTQLSNGDGGEKKSHPHQEEGFVKLKKGTFNGQSSTNNKALYQNQDSKKEHLFKDSQYYDFEVFRAEFEKDEVYACYSARAIHEELKLACEEKGYMYKDWLIRAKRWCKKEETDKFLIKNTQKNGKSNFDANSFAQIRLARMEERRRTKNSDNE